MSLCINWIQGFSANAYEFFWHGYYGDTIQHENCQWYSRRTPSADSPPAAAPPAPPGNGIHDDWKVM